MKILLPKSLAEPLTISWELIVFNDAETVNRIWRTLHRYLDSLERDGFAPLYGDSSRFSTDTVEDSLRVLTRRMGGIEVSSICGQILEHSECTGHIYHVFFRLRKGGWQRELQLRSR